MDKQSPVLVTGATGYVGGRLVPRLIEAGYSVRVMVRDSSRLQGRTWVKNVEVAQGDVLEPDTLPETMKGIGVAYYLIHSMGGGANFHTRDLSAARAFGNAARQAGIQRIIYLGGMGDPNSDLSEHLRSRQQTGNALREAGVPVTEFRAAIIVGSGSLSFEMIRYLTERLPIIICPQWVFTRVQPISIRNVLEYLIGALDQIDSTGKVIEIGGTDTLTYGEMIIQYARVRGLKRWLLPVPLISPQLLSYWVHLVTPLPAVIAHPLIDGLRNEVVVRDHTAEDLFPNIRPLDYENAVRAALARLQAGNVETSWSDALVTTQGSVPPVIFTTQEGMAFEHRQLLVNTDPQAVYASFSQLGGDQGWLYMNWVWQLRGVLDRLVGGVGMRRGRRDPCDVRVGDALDFWRVEAVEPSYLMRLRAEMKVPGLAWLEFRARPQQDGQTLLTQTAFFAPKGMLGWWYWYMLYPIHKLIFSGMIRRIAERALQFNNEVQGDYLPGN